MVLFAKGGASLDDIAIRGSTETVRSEKATIFAQGLIAVCKISPGAIAQWFDNNEDGLGMIEEATVRPYDMGEIDYNFLPTIDVSRKDGQAAAKRGEVNFGYEADSAWWPYALLYGAFKAGWGRRKGEELTGGYLAQQTLALLSGFDASMIEWKGFADTSLGRLEEADDTPFLLQLRPFDVIATSDLKNRRWEEWVTVMHYDGEARLLDYATSFYDGEGGITEQKVALDDIEGYIVNIVWLNNFDKISDQRAPPHTPSSGSIAAGPAGTEGASFGQPAS